MYLNKFRFFDSLNFCRCSSRLDSPQRVWQAPCTVSLWQLQASVTGHSASPTGNGPDPSKTGDEQNCPVGIGDALTTFQLFTSLFFYQAMRATYLTPRSGQCAPSRRTWCSSTPDSSAPWSQSAVCRWFSAPFRPSTASSAAWVEPATNPR